MLFYLGQDKESQDELREEVSKLLGDGDVSYNHLKELPKVTAFMNEYFRVRNPALSLVPRLVITEHQIKDVKLERGTAVFTRKDGSLRTIRSPS